MYEVLRAGRVIKSRFLGYRTYEETRQAAIARFGKGIALKRVF